jgi:hypothetical protein
MQMLASPALAVSSKISECTITGTAGNDVLTGTPGADIICGLGGNDVIHSGAGKDRIFGGSGDDEIFGEAGADLVDGGAGSDEISGGSGNDSLVGSNGADSLSGGQGKDSISGGAGGDILLGGSGNDNLSGGNNVDVIDGGAGADKIRTGTGADMCGEDSSDVHLDACSIDTTAPQVGVLMAPGMQFSAGTTAVFTIKVFDQSGTASVYGKIGGPPGWVTEWCGFGIPGVLTEGTDKSGVYQISCTIPENAVNDKYTLFVGTSDLMGNYSAELTVDFDVTGGSSDNKTPAITKIELPDQVGAGEPFVIRVSATDESSVVGVYAWFALEGGWISDGVALYVPYSEARFVSQTATEAVIEQDAVFAENAPAGTYRIWLSIRDGVGNRDFSATESTIILNK